MRQILICAAVVIALGLTAFDGLAQAHEAEVCTEPQLRLLAVNELRGYIAFEVEPCIIPEPSGNEWDSPYGSQYHWMSDLPEWRGCTRDNNGNWRRTLWSLPCYPLDRD